jgi:predicted metal-dependent hydrolase
MRNSFEEAAALPSGTIIRSRRRSIGLIITPDATLVVRAPFHAPAGAIRDFVRQKSAWIDRKLAEAAARPKPHPKEFKDGENFLYRGGSYPLSIVDAAASPLAFDGTFRLAKRSVPGARQTFMAWYKDQASALIRERLDRYSSSSGITYSAFNVTGARSRWGSCSAKGRLNFSWRLALAPGHVLDYVVVHELAHLEHRNHSRLFWDRVADIFPPYLDSERWIKDHGHLCDIR